MMETIKEAKQFLRANFEKGVDCPCCGQFVKLYKRKLNSGMALFLIGLMRLWKKNPNKQFFSNKEVMNEMNLAVTSLDYSVMRHFGLIEPRISEAGKRDSGYWRMTPKGFLFVQGHKSSKYIFLYRNKRQGVSDEQITIREALGEKFDYEELMKAK